MNKLNHIYSTRYAEAGEVEAFYNPSFYSMVVNGDVECDKLVERLRDRIARISNRVLSGDDVETWFAICHEYVHFLQDIRCANLRHDAVCRLRIALGCGRELADDAGCQNETCGKTLKVKGVERGADGNWTVSFDNYEAYVFSKVALVECIAIVLEDKLREACDGARQEDYLPYDLPYRVAEYILRKKAAKLADLKASVIDICEAALETEDPVSVFVEYLKYVAKRSGCISISYDDVLSWCLKHRQRRCEEHDDKVFKREVDESIGQGKLSALVYWLARKVERVSALMRTGKLGLFRSIYECRVVSGKGLVDQLAHMMKEIAYPLIEDQSRLYCYEGDVNEIGSWLCIATAYDIVMGNGSSVPCSMLRICRQANNPALNGNYAEAPKVSAFCENDPRQVRQADGKNCPFSLVWEAHCRNKNRGRICSR